jgi:hypothetical protein
MRPDGRPDGRTTRNQRRNAKRTATGAPRASLAGLSASDTALDGALDGTGADGETPDRAALRQRREEAARRILAETPQLTSAKLAQRIAVATRIQCSVTTARNIREMLAAERQAERQAERMVALAEGVAGRPPLHIITTPTAPSLQPDALADALTHTADDVADEDEAEERRQN